MPKRALGPDPAAVPFHDALRDVETQPHPSSIVVDLHEALEHGFQPGGGDADARVAHREEPAIRLGPVRRIDPHADAALDRELERIVDKV